MGQSLTIGRQSSRKILFRTLRVSKYFATVRAEQILDCEIAAFYCRRYEALPCLVSNLHYTLSKPLFENLNHNLCIRSGY